MSIEPSPNPAARFLQLLSELIGQPRFRVAVLLALLGISGVVFSYVYETYLGSSVVISFVASSIGVALLVTAIAEFILLEHASRAIASEMNQIIGKLRNDFSIVSHSGECGLLDVITARRDRSLNRPLRFRKAVAQALQERNDKIYILGVSLQEFLGGGRHFASHIQRFIEDDNNVLVHMLLLDPTCNAARIRATAEEGRREQHINTQLYNDLRTSIISLRNLKNRAAQCERFKIDARFTNIHPMFYMILTSDMVFIEPYHLGRLEGDPTCIGGSVPAFVFSSNSEIYHRAKSHFEYVWNSTNQEADDSDRDTANQWYDGKFLLTKTLEEIIQTMEPIARDTGEEIDPQHNCLTSGSLGHIEVIA